MTKLLINNKNYLELLLSTSREQALTLLHTATAEQGLMISEIAKNILHLPLPKQAKRYVKSKKSLLRHLARRSLSKRERQRIIRKHAKYLLQVFWSLREPFYELL